MLLGYISFCTTQNAAFGIFIVETLPTVLEKNVIVLLVAFAFVLYLVLPELGVGFRQQIACNLR